MDLSILHPHIKIDHPYLFLGCLFISLTSNLGGFAPLPPPPLALNLFEIQINGKRMTDLDLC
jgi:hypothetical protein